MDDEGKKSREEVHILKNNYYLRCGHLSIDNRPFLLVKIEIWDDFLNR